MSLIDDLLKELAPVRAVLIITDEESYSSGWTNLTDAEASKLMAEVSADVLERLPAPSNIRN